MSYQIELRHLHYFHVLAGELHFRKAAQRLFISQPGLSRQIKQMEEIYGVSLLERGKRSVKLTAAGSYLNREIEQLFIQISKIERDVRYLGENPVSQLRLGFIGSAVQTLLAELLMTLKRDHPRIEVEIQELSNILQLEMLLREELDFGFVRIDAVPNGILTIPILTEHFCLVVSKNHTIQQHNFKSLDDFKQEEFILFSKEYSQSYYDLVMSIFRDADFVPRVSLRTVNALTIFNLVQQGLGVALVPASLKRGYNIDVNFIDLDMLDQRTTLSLAWNKNKWHQGMQFLLNIVHEKIGDL
ncbi:LysR family transcriptional regulator [Sphingobacterium shayense]|uniref:LysR family transcriptional regulator n=1 Tax=Sphingobacterium shayense TaxID=626343 RepID=UPI001557391B|nr:LysR family transcriptional regulator [Sphingobacterium shayense]NQD70454.1 LysR family transcriptional regulator [Sphingobacterium shayense]